MKWRAFLPDWATGYWTETYDGLDGDCQNISTIGYVLFHCRKTEGQHLFAVRGTCNVVSAEAVAPDNVSTTDFYLTVDIDTSIELDATGIDSTKKPFAKEARYDAQFALLKDL